MKYKLFNLGSDMEGITAVEAKLNALAETGWSVVPGIVINNSWALLQKIRVNTNGPI